VISNHFAGDDTDSGGDGSFDEYESQAGSQDRESQFTRIHRDEDDGEMGTRGGEDMAVMLVR